MSAETFNVETVNLLLTGFGAVVAAIGVIARLVGDGMERAAKRVGSAVAVRDALTSSLPRSADINSLEQMVELEDVMREADRAIVRESLVFQNVASDRWRVRRLRPFVLILVGLVIVIAFVLVREFAPPLSTVWLAISVAVYLFGCLLTGIGGVDLAISRLRSRMDKHLSMLGLPQVQRASA